MYKMIGYVTIIIVNKKSYPDSEVKYNKSTVKV